MFATKPADWGYEREVRLLIPRDDESTNPLKTPYSHEAVKRIILGERMTDDARFRAGEIASPRYPKAIVFQTCVSKEEYRIQLRSK
jgi:hypothetical protein